MLQADLLLVFHVIYAIYVILSTQMWPENQVSRVLGEVEHKETLCILLYMKKSEI